MAKRVHGGRALLNKKGHQSTAAMVAEITDTGAKITSHRYYPYALLQMSDCDRSINWDFEWSDKADRENNLYKVNTMLGLLTKFRDGMELEIERYEAREGKQDEISVW